MDRELLHPINTNCVTLCAFLNKIVKYITNYLWLFIQERKIIKQTALLSTTENPPACLVLCFLQKSEVDDNFKKHNFKTIIAWARYSLVNYCHNPIFFQKHATYWPKACKSYQGAVPYSINCHLYRIQNFGKIYFRHRFI